MMMLLLSSHIPHTTAEETTVRGGIAITFDDSHFEDWLELAELYEGQDVRFTFFVAGWMNESEWSILGRLQELGHEIGAHTQTHQHAQDVVDAKGLQAYLYEEVDHQLEELSEHGINASSFAAPFGEMQIVDGGVRIDLRDHLLERFEIIRDVTASSSPSAADRIFHQGQNHRTATALRIDCNEGLTPDNHSLVKSIERARLSGETLVLYGHGIAFENETKCTGFTPIWRVEQLVDAAREAGLEFRTMSDMLDAPNPVEDGYDIVEVAFTVLALALAAGLVWRRWR